MGDVAQILKTSKGSTAANAQIPKAVQLSGVSKDVQEMLGRKQDPRSAAMPPMVPFFSKQRASVASDGDKDPSSSTKTEIKTKVGNKWISSEKKAREWAWAPFASSSRTDGAMFNHWVRANIEYTDYPYAKFDIHLDPVIYNDEEYKAYLKSDTWTRSETDALLEMARVYELRWAVIYDRWMEKFEFTNHNPTQALRKLEDLQERYYNVAAILNQLRIRQEAAAEVQALSATSTDLTTPEGKEAGEKIVLETAAARAIATAAPKTQPLITTIGTGSSNKLYDVNYERARRAHLDRMWRRSKEEESEETELRKQIRAIDAQLRKLKKAGGHILAAKGAVNGGRPPSAAASRNPSRSVSPVPGAAIVDNPELLNSSFASTAPVPMPQTPYLQSGRLAPPATGGSGGLNKSMLARMDQILGELKVPANPLPTKRVCDVYDTVRRDALVLLTLQKLVLQKEGNIQARRVRLSKLGGAEHRVLEEEALLGIAPPPAPAPAAPAPAPKKSSKSKSTSKSTSKSKPSSSASKTKSAASKTATKSKTSDNGPSGKSDSKDSTKKTKPAPKRKRKSDAATKDTKKSAATASSTTPGTTKSTAAAAAVKATPGGASGTTPKGKPTAKTASAAKTPAASDSTAASAKKRPRKV